MVDDDPEVLEIITDLLDGSGYGVRNAGNVAAAIKVLEAGGIETLISDIRLGPGENGLWLAGEATRRWPAVKIILMSGYTSAMAELEAAPWPFLRKPMRMAAILALLAAN